MKRPLRLPKILTQQRDFAEIDKFMRAVERNQVDEARFPDGQWRIASTTTDKEMYCVLTAMEGWCECFCDIAKAIGDTTYTDAPMRSMMAKLKADMPMTKKHVQEIKAVVEHQRKLYMQAPDGIINQISTSLLQEAAA